MLEDEKAALALALEDEKAALTLALEKKKAAQGRGSWEAVFGFKRETAQLLNLVAGGVIFISSGTYLMNEILDRSWQRTHEMISSAELRIQAAQSKAELSAKVAQSKAETASQDVRALMSNAQRAWFLFCVPFRCSQGLTLRARALVTSAMCATTGRGCTTGCTPRGHPLTVSFQSKTPTALVRQRRGPHGVPRATPPSLAPAPTYPGRPHQQNQDPGGGVPLDEGREGGQRQALPYAIKPCGLREPLR
jgi:hypothetical protein